MATHIAFLRGINVGGKNKLSMRSLVEIFVQTGCQDASTYIQSGNMIFRASQSIAAQVPKRVAQEIAKHFGYNTPVVVRTADQLRHAFTNNPFLSAEAAAPEDILHVMFLADQPSSDRIASLDPQRSQPDEFIVKSNPLAGEIYLKLPSGVAKTKLTNAYFDSKLRTVSTLRNWRTVGKLVDLLSE